MHSGSRSTPPSRQPRPSGRYLRFRRSGPKGSRFVDRCTPLLPCRVTGHGFAPGNLWSGRMLTRVPHQIRVRRREHLVGVVERERNVSRTTRLLPADLNGPSGLQLLKSGAVLELGELVLCEPKNFVRSVANIFPHGAELLKCVVY